MKTSTLYCRLMAMVFATCRATCAAGRLALSRKLKEGLRLVVPTHPQVLGACFNCARLCGVDSVALRERLMAEYGNTQA